MKDKDSNDQEINSTDTYYYLFRAINAEGGEAAHVVADGEKFQVLMKDISDEASMIGDDFNKTFDTYKEAKDYVMNLWPDVERVCFTDRKGDADWELMLDEAFPASQSGKLEEISPQQEIRIRKKLATTPLKKLIQIDGFVEPTFIDRDAKEGPEIWKGESWEAFKSVGKGMPVRVFIAPESPTEQVVSALREIVDWIEKDGTALESPCDIPF